MLGAGPGWSQDRWGEAQGFPTGWGAPRTLSQSPSHRVGNYSGGFERMFPCKTISAAGTPLVLGEDPMKDFRYRWGFSSKSPDEYLDQLPVTGLLICRNAQVVFERHRFARRPEMRMTSWSMAKSMTSLLLGICLDRKLIASYDDAAEKYVPELQGTLHGQCTLRNLSNMSSGAEVNHNRDNPKIYPAAFTTQGANIRRTVADWNNRREEQGRTYNYNELCPLTIGLVIRKVTGMPLSEFAQGSLWQPLGAEADATWTTDSEGQEFNCVGFAARLRDWARVGILIANRGRAGQVQVVSEAWIDEVTRWGAQDSQCRVGVAMRGAGYKAHMWHARPDGSRLYFNGHHGQRVIVDMPTKSVLVQTAVEDKENWDGELGEMVNAIARA